MAINDDVKQFDTLVGALLKKVSAEDLYKNSPNFRKTINLFSAKILKELFDQYKVGSHIDFEDVASKIHTRETSIGSILSKIKKLRLGKETKSEDKKTKKIKVKKADEIAEKKEDEKMIKEVVENLRGNKPEIIAPKITPPKTAKTIKIKKEPVKLERVKLERQKLKVKRIDEAKKKIPRTVNDGVVFNAYGNNAPFMRQVMEKTIGLLDKQENKDEFIRGYIDALGKYSVKRMISGHGGDIQKLISSIGWHVFQLKFKDTDEFKKTTKKGYFELFEINSRSCHRSLEKVIAALS